MIVNRKVQVIVLLVLLAACDQDATQPTPVPTGPDISEPVTPELPPSSPKKRGETLLAAGDIGDGKTEIPSMTGKMLDSLPGQILALGDIAYPHGSRDEFLRYFDPYWGRHKSRMWAVSGNHDYDQPGRPYFFEYFGEEEYFARDLGAWKIYGLNSNIATRPGSTQYRWLQQELETSTNKCSLAAWHFPITSSGRNGDSPQLIPMWQLLADHGVDILLAGHDHMYERYAQQDRDLRAAPGRGIRQFIAGTGGAGLYERFKSTPNSEVFISEHGFLQLVLNDGDYEWSFVSINGGVPDSGSEVCY